MVEQNEAKLLQNGGQRFAVCPQILHQTLTFTFDTRIGRLLASRSDQGCADCEHRLQHVGCSPVLHDAAINHSVEVHSGVQAILHHPPLRSAKMTNAALRSEGYAGSEDVRFAVLTNYPEGQTEDIDAVIIGTPRLVIASIPPQQHLQQLQIA